MFQSSFCCTIKIWIMIFCILVYSDRCINQQCQVNGQSLPEKGWMCKTGNSSPKGGFNIHPFKWVWWVWGLKSYCLRMQNFRYLRGRFIKPTQPKLKMSSLSKNHLPGLQIRQLFVRRRRRRLRWTSSSVTCASAETSAGFAAKAKDQ